MKHQSRLAHLFLELAKNKEKAVIFFTTAGDPSLAVTRQTLRFCEDVGVDCVEIGVPFSDPLADGPIIQAASYRALKKGVHSDLIFKMVRAERKCGLTLPLVLMSSYNPIMHYGQIKFLKMMRRAEIDGLIVPDLPIHEAGIFLQACRKYGIDLILMETPTTPDMRKRLIQKESRGFTYYVSLTGVTGIRSKRSIDFKGDVRHIQRMAKTPVCVGFGISDAEQARRISRFADGVIVGSALVQNLHENSKRNLSQKSKTWIRQLVQAVKKR